MTQLDERADLPLDAHAQDLLFRNARSLHKFSAAPVSDDLIRAVHDLVKNGPTSLNQQPLRVVLVRSSSARERLVAHMLDNNKEKTANAPLSLIMAADLDFHEKLPELFPHLPTAKELFGDSARRTDSARLNAMLQVGYFIIGARAAGLTAGPMVGFDVPAVTRDFLGDGNLTPLVVMNVGFQEGEAPYPRLPRLDYGDVFTTA